MDDRFSGILNIENKNSRFLNYMLKYSYCFILQYVYVIMTAEMIFVALMIILMLVLLLFEVARADFVIFFFLVIFLLSGTITAEQALSGFSNEGMLTVLLLFIV